MKEPLALIGAAADTFFRLTVAPSFVVPQRSFDSLSVAESTTSDLESIDQIKGKIPPSEGWKDGRDTFQ